MKRKWKDKFIKRGLAWMLCVLLVMQLVGADSLIAMADKAGEILTAEAQESTGEENTAEAATTEKTKAAEETITEKAIVEESLEPEKVVEILNHYLNLTTNAIFKNHGTLDKFVGDATMAVFNSPIDLDDYVFKAVCAAMDIVESGAALEEKLMKEMGRTIGFGVGVNCGPAVVGNVGCEFRMDFTAIGDTVNTAARLEANAKKGQVLISDEVYRRLEGRITAEEIGEIPLKGKSNKICVYSVTAVQREQKN